MKERAIRVALFCVLALAPRSLRADGGAVCLQESSGAFLVTVFATPAMLRAGPVDLSVLVQDGVTQAVLPDSAVSITLNPGSGGSSIDVRATRQQSTNKLLQSAVINLPSAGQWELKVSVRRGPDQAVVKTQVRVELPLPRFASVWPLAALPPIAVLLFAGHQVLRRRRLCQLE